MTEFQAKQIRDLRLQVTGYRAIASVVGLSRDIVRNYCKSHGLDGYASVLTINMKEQMLKGQACLACGKEIVQPMTGRKRKFCSDECRRSWWSAHQDDLKKKPTARSPLPLTAIRTENTAPMNAMSETGSSGRKKDGSRTLAPPPVRRKIHECNAMENPVGGCTPSGSV